VNSPVIKIGHKKIGENHPVFIIAEISANHLQDYDTAVKTIIAAKNAGVDAVKIQTYTPDTITIDCDAPDFQLSQGTIWDGTTLYKLYQKAYTPWDWQPKLQEIAQDLGLIFFSSPFDRTAVDFLEELEVPAYKIASFEITDIPLIQYIASKNKPMLVSSGIATINDIQRCIETCEQEGNNRVILLKCTSAYPTDPKDMHLNTITDMKKSFNIIIGLSDHTIGVSAPITAVALGAKVIEKHIILDRKMGGPDAEFSTEPDEFKILVEHIRKTEKMLGSVQYNLSEKQKISRKFCRSLFVVSHVKEGDIITEENVRSIRPGTGLHPRYLKEIIGKRFGQNATKGTPFSKDLMA